MNDTAVWQAILGESHKILQNEHRFGGYDASWYPCPPATEKNQKTKQTSKFARHRLK
jgi:hypothetical protein